MAYILCSMNLFFTNTLRESIALESGDASHKIKVHCVCIYNKSNNLRI